MRKAAFILKTSTSLLINVQDGIMTLEGPVLIKIALKDLTLANLAAKLRMVAFLEINVKKELEDASASLMTDIPTRTFVSGSANQFLIDTVDNTEQAIPVIYLDPDDPDDDMIRVMSPVMQL